MILSLVTLIPLIIGSYALFNWRRKQAEVKRRDFVGRLEKRLSVPLR